MGHVSVAERAPAIPPARRDANCFCDVIDWSFPLRSAAAGARAGCGVADADADADDDAEAEEEDVDDENEGGGDEDSDFVAIVGVVDAAVSDWAEHISTRACAPR